MNISIRKAMIKKGLLFFLLSSAMSSFSRYSSEGFVQGQHPRLNEQSSIRHLSSPLFRDIVDLAESPVAIVNMRNEPVYLIIKDTNTDPKTIIWRGDLSAKGNQFEIDPQEIFLHLPQHLIEITVYRKDDDRDKLFLEGSITIDADEANKVIKIEINEGRKIILYYANGDMHQVTIKDTRRW